MNNIVTLAMNPSIDKTSSVEIVAAERKLYCKPPCFEPGGGGVNVSRAIKKLGGESMLLCTAGDFTGRRLMDLLDQEGISHQSIDIAGMTRESLVVLEESTGRQFRFGMPGPFLSEEEWKRCLDEVTALCKKDAFLVASGSLPPGVPSGFYARVARIGKDHGAKVIIDTSGDALYKTLQEGVYMVKANYREFKSLVGQDMTDDKQIEEQAVKMVKDGRCEVMVISLGAAGALMVSENLVEYVSSPTVPIVSKIGAGDSMVAGIVLLLTRGHSLSNAVRFGIAAGAAAVMTPGSELCRRVDVERLYAKMAVNKRSAGQPASLVYDTQTEDEENIAGVKVS